MFQKSNQRPLSIKMAANCISVIPEPLPADPLRANVLRAQALWQLQRAQPCSCVWAVLLFLGWVPAQGCWLRLDSWCLKWVSLGPSQGLFSRAHSQLPSPHRRDTPWFFQLPSTSSSLSICTAYSFTQSRLSKKQNREGGKKASPLFQLPVGSES